MVSHEQHRSGPESDEGTAIICGSTNESARHPLRVIWPLRLSQVYHESVLHSRPKLQAFSEKTGWHFNFFKSFPYISQNFLLH